MCQLNVKLAFDALRLSTVHLKGLLFGDWLLAFRTPEAHLMPFRVKGNDSLVGDGFGAALAPVRVL